MTVELSRPVPLDRLPAAFTVEADAAERAALALRLNIPAVESLLCRFALHRRGGVVTADGELAAEVVQTCVVTLEPAAQSVREAFRVRFVPQGAETEDDDPDAPDELTYTGATLDLGEAAAEQLALALDPYPRAPGATLDSPGEEAETSPFAALLRR